MDRKKRNELLSKPQYNSVDVRKKLIPVANIAKSFENPINNLEKVFDRKLHKVKKLLLVMMQMLILILYVICSEKVMNVWWIRLIMEK